MQEATHSQSGLWSVKPPSFPSTQKLGATCKSTLKSRSIKSGPVGAAGGVHDLKIDLAAALQELFEAYDEDGNGYIDIEEFVRGQAALATNVGHPIDQRDSLSHFLSQAALGTVDGMRFTDFVEWQMSLMAKTRIESQADMARVCRWCATRLLKVKPAAGQATSAIRQQRVTKERPLRPGGGGGASMRQGFVERNSVVAQDMSSFDDVEDNLSAAGDDEQQQIPGDDPTDEEIARLAKELRELRRLCRFATSATEAAQLRAEAAQADKHIRSVWKRRQELRRGKLVVKGVVMSESSILTGAFVHLCTAGQAGKGQDLSVTTSSNRLGGFTHCVDARLGRKLTVTARKKGFADNVRRTGGEGVKHIKFNLIPMSVKGEFKADAFGKGIAAFDDVGSGVHFGVPVDGMLKAGKPFTGDALFSAAVVDASKKDNINSMPTLVGRGLDGSWVRMQSLGAVFVEICDANDGAALALLKGINVEFPSMAPLPLRPPSIWHFDAVQGAWEQTALPLCVNGFELPAIDPDLEAQDSRSREAEFCEPEQLAQDHREAVKIIRDGQAAMNRQQEVDFAEKICTCGFCAKRDLMPLVRECHALPLADPPKRIFAKVGFVSGGYGPGAHLEYPYETIKERIKSAKKASEDPEVILSHHLVFANQILGDSTVMARGSTRKHREARRKALESVSKVAAWLLERARVVDVVSGESVDNVEPLLLPMRVLEHLANIWAQPQQANSTACTVAELREALVARCGNVAAALLDIADIQAERDDVARVRALLKEIDEFATVKYRDAVCALQASDGNTELAAQELSNDANVKLQAEKLRVRKHLYARMKMAHPTSEEVELVIAEAAQKKRELEAAALDKQTQAKTAVEELAIAQARREAADKALVEATASGDPLAREEAENAVTEANELARIAQATLAKIEAEAEEARRYVDESAANFASTAAQQLAESDNVQARAKKVYESWQNTLEAANKINSFGFQIENTGWNNIDAPEDTILPISRPAPLPSADVEEFYPAQPLPICPVRVSSMVLGAFDDGIFATTVSANGVDYRGVDYTEEVQPDGTFSLIAMAYADFELHTQKRDGTSSFSFGPFTAQASHRITHLGLLEPSQAQERAAAQPVAAVDVVFPRLEFPHTREERCTCFDDEENEGEEEGYGDEY